MGFYKNFFFSLKRKSENTKRTVWSKTLFEFLLNLLLNVVIVIPPPSKMENKLYKKNFSNTGNKKPGAKKKKEKKKKKLKTVFQRCKPRAALEKNPQK